MKQPFGPRSGILVHRRGLEPIRYSLPFLERSSSILIRTASPVFLSVSRPIRQPLYP